MFHPGDDIFALFDIYPYHPAKITVSPEHVHTYVMLEMSARQLHWKMENRVSGKNNKFIGNSMTLSN